MPCSPIFAGSSATAYTSNFTYDGPSLSLFESGQHILERSYYADSACTIPYMTVIEEGTFQQTGASDVDPVRLLPQVFVAGDGCPILSETNGGQLF